MVCFENSFIICTLFNLFKKNIAATSVHDSVHNYFDSFILIIVHWQRGFGVIVEGMVDQGDQDH